MADGDTGFDARRAAIRPRVLRARRRTRRILTMLSVAVLLGAGAGSTARAARSASLTDYMDKPTRQWREGPVRYIITEWEDKEYKALENESDRARFIENFWRRRDTTPETPGNEFRSDFWRRASQANRLYGEETAKPGWKTDMGKMHILMGPPDDISRDLMAEGHRGTVVWTYRNSGVPGVGPNVVVAFARDVTGEFRLSTEPTEDANVKQGIPIAYQPPMGTNALAKAQILRAQERMEALYNLTDPLIRGAGGPATASPLELTSQLVKLQSPPAEWQIQETVVTQEFFGAVPVSARVDFFKTTGSKTLVVLSAGVRSTAVHFRRIGGKERPDLVFYAVILDLTGNDQIASLSEDDDFVPARENDTAGLDDLLVYQARLLLDPGSYKARVTALDRAGGRSGTYVMNLSVPDLTAPRLEISSLMLARSIAPSETEAGQQFVMGNLRIVPRLTQTFAKTDDLAFYYQVYGAQTDPQSGRPSLDVDYGFYTVTAEEETDLGHVTFEAQTNESHGYSVALDEWPAGPYMMRVSITDRLAQTTATRDLVFEIR